MEPQHSNEMKCANDLVGVVIKLLGTIHEIRESNQVVHSVHDRDSLSGVRSFKDPLSDILEALKATSRDDNVQHSVTTASACITIVRDILVRIRVVDDGVVPFEQAWNGESITALENHITWIRAEVQQNGKEIIASAETDASIENAPDDFEQLSIKGSRRLWTGPAQSKGPMVNNELAVGLNSDVTKEDPTLVEAVQKTLLNVDKSELLQEFFLESLTFTSMNDREEEVNEAHNQTFQWIFASEKQPKATSGPFVPWLTSDNGGRIYWINGKAGSGKSTLMNFITTHRDTKRHLKAWAGSQQLIVINFFFWTSGSVLQRSQIGLLRSLLFQLLKQQPDLIPWAFPRLWLTCQDTKKRVEIMLSWEAADLLKGLRIALNVAARKNNTKICMFIDGLDEFEGSEDTIIGLVRDVVNLSPNIKACVSSRPWAAFGKAFQNVPHILLQDLTREDMDNYVSAQMKDNKLIRRIVRREADDSGLKSFKTEMMKRADGVFLWTTLALRYIISAVKKDDALADIYGLLLQLPSDLEDLFRHLLFNDRAADDLAGQSHVFQLIRARDEVCDFTGDDSARSISLYQMILAYQGKMSSIRLPIHQCDQNKVLVQCRDFAGFLEDKCANLIILSNQDKVYARTHARFHADDGQDANIHAETNRRVHYLHRTVRDFLDSSGVWPEIISNGSSDFDPHIALLLSHVLRLRFPIDEPEQHRRLDEWWHDDVVLGMTHARLASAPCIEAERTQAVLLDRLNDTLQSLWRKKPSDTLDNWARHAFASYEERMKHRTPFHHPFISLAAKFGLATYIRVKLNSGKYNYNEGIPILSHGVEFLMHRRKTVYPLAEPKAIQAMLESGQTPNQLYQDLRAKSDTPWLLALKYVREAERRQWLRPFDIQGTQRWVAILSLMLDHGADPKAVIVKDAWDPETTALGVISSVALKYLSEDVYQLKERLETMAKSM